MIGVCLTVTARRRRRRLFGGSVLIWPREAPRRGIPCDKSCCPFWCMPLSHSVRTERRIRPTLGAIPAICATAVTRAENRSSGIFSLAAERALARVRSQSRRSGGGGRPGIEPGSYGLIGRSSDSLAPLPAQLPPHSRLAALLSLVSRHRHRQTHRQLGPAARTKLGGSAIGPIAVRGRHVLSLPRAVRFPRSPDFAGNR
jgi:hypothetical protein